MARKISILILVCFSLLMGCDNIESKYYDTGELQEEIKNSGSSCKEVISYYKNGQKASIGKICNDLREGNWREWYADGSMKWEGEYKNGNPNYRDINLKKLNCILTIKGNPDILQTGETYLLRVSIIGIHPQDIIVASNNGMIYFYENREEYDFKIVPEKKGNLKLYTFVESEYQKELACEILLQVK